MLKINKLYKFIIAIIIFPAFLGQAQADTNIFSKDILWADTLLGFTSQATARGQSKKLYSASQALGKPNTMADFGESPSAWMPIMGSKSIEWISVGFKTPNMTKQIIISESINPGAISKVVVTDVAGKETVAFSNLNPQPTYQNGRMFSIFLDKAIENVKSIKIELSTIDYVDYYQIDAIGITNLTEKVEYAINLPDEISSFQKENLGEGVNSEYYELGPVISADGKKLFFTRDKHRDNIGSEKNQDVWMSLASSDGTFGTATNIGSPVNNGTNNFIIGSTQDANTIYLGNIYLASGEMGKGISKSEFSGSEWSFPEKIEVEDYYNNNPNASYAFSANGKTMILAVERDDAFGQTDLYASFLQTSGRWSEPINLGSQLNTASGEVSPFLAADGVSLYFSSGGFPGYGKNDMFMTRRLDSTWQNWSEPLNLGSSINTAGWDAYYTVTASGEWAYFVSNSDANQKEDIFRIRLQKAVKPLDVVIIHGKVLNSKTKSPLKASILYETLSDGKNAGVANSNEQTGEYTISLPAGQAYGFLAQAKGFASVNENIDLSKLDSFKIIERNLYLVPIESGQKVRLNNIFFDFGKYELLPQSAIELKRVVELLIENKEISIIIEGYTDNIGTNSANKALSQKRAKAVYDFLIEKGIIGERLSFKGYGAARPTSTNDTEEGRQQNRRVEFSIK